MSRPAWAVAIAASVLMALAVGGRSAYGLFVSPLNTASGLGLTALSLALAFGQLGIGFVQPWVGAFADRHGAARLIASAAVLTAGLTVLPALASAPAVVILSVVLSAVVGSAVGSNGLLVGEVTRRVPAERAGLAIGVVGAGASVGQLVLGPITQSLIDHQGWMLALVAFAATSLLAVPLARLFRPLAAQTAANAAVPSAKPPSLTHELHQWSFWRVAGSFGMCGFHVGFLTAHMPGVIERCGLPTSLAGPWLAVAGAANVAGSLLVGLALRRHDAAWVLMSLYAVRVLAITALLLLPVMPSTMLAFAVLMGASHMATLPPTAQLVARQHGTARLGALFGTVMLVHQVGSFAGIALGGWAADATGSDTALWLVDAALALVALALVAPSRSRPLPPSFSIRAVGPGRSSPAI